MRHAMSRPMHDVKSALTSDVGTRVSTHASLTEASHGMLLRRLVVITLPRRPIRFRGFRFASPPSRCDSRYSKPSIEGSINVWYSDLARVFTGARRKDLHSFIFFTCIRLATFNGRLILTKFLVKQLNKMKMFESKSADSLTGKHTVCRQAKACSAESCQGRATRVSVFTGSQ